MTKRLTFLHKVSGSLRLGEWVSKSCSVVSSSLWLHGLYSPWNSPGQNTGVGSRSLLQGISPTQGWNPGLPYCKWILYQLSNQGSPRVLEWIAYLISSGSSQSRNWTRVSFTAGRFFTSWATREAKTMWNAVKIWLSILQLAHFQRASIHKILCEYECFKPWEVAIIGIVIPILKMKGVSEIASSMKTYTLPYVKYATCNISEIAVGSCCMSQRAWRGALWQPWGVRWGGRWEASSRWRGHVHTYGWFMLMCGRNQHTIVKQLSSDYKLF